MANKPSAKTGRLVATGRSRTASGRLMRGARVKVRLGARFHNGTVIEERNGRVRVEIHVDGADEPIISSYAIDELTPA